MEDEDKIVDEKVTPTKGVRIRHSKRGWLGAIIYGPTHGIVRVQWDGLVTTEYLTDIVADDGRTLSDPELSGGVTP